MPREVAIIDFQTSIIYDITATTFNKLHQHSLIHENFDSISFHTCVHPQEKNERHIRRSEYHEGRPFWDTLVYIDE